MKEKKEKKRKGKRRESEEVRFDKWRVRERTVCIKFGTVKGCGVCGMAYYVRNHEA